MRYSPNAVVTEHLTALASKSVLSQRDQCEVPYSYGLLQHEAPDKEKRESTIKLFCSNQEGKRTRFSFFLLTIQYSCKPVTSGKTTCNRNCGKIKAHTTSLCKHVKIKQHSQPILYFLDFLGLDFIHWIMKSVFQTKAIPIAQTEAPAMLR